MILKKKVHQRVHPRENLFQTGLGCQIEKKLAEEAKWRSNFKKLDLGASVSLGGGRRKERESTPRTSAGKEVE